MPWPWAQADRGRPRDRVLVYGRPYVVSRTDAWPPEADAWLKLADVMPCPDGPVRVPARTLVDAGARAHHGILYDAMNQARSRSGCCGGLRPIRHTHPHAFLTAIPNSPIWSADGQMMV